MAKRTAPYNRRPANRHQIVVSRLQTAIDVSGVPLTAVQSLLGVSYISLHKYLSRERNVTSDALAKKMLAVATLLNDMVMHGVLPIPDEVNYRQRKTVVLELVNNYVLNKPTE